MSQSFALEFYNQTVIISIVLSVSPLDLSSKLSKLGTEGGHGNPSETVMWVTWGLTFVTEV